MREVHIPPMANKLNQLVGHDGAQQYLGGHDGAQPSPGGHQSQSDHHGHHFVKLCIKKLS